MTEAKTADAVNAPEKPEEEQETFGSFAWFVVKLAIAALLFRSLLFSPFSIPSESMLPRLLIGDYLVASKWPYGYTKHSLPFSLPLIPGRVWGDPPERGDIAIFKHPIDESDYIKRVIGLPGDTVEMRDGVLVLNGEPVKKERIEDFIQVIDPHLLAAAARANRPYPCAMPGLDEVREDGQRVCRYPRYRETLPSGVTYEVLDIFDGVKDNWGPKIVPEGMVFMMGDNRDNSQDGRFDPKIPQERLGVGWVPMENLVGRAEGMMWSTDGSSEWIKPWTWFSAARWERIGDGI